MAPIKAPTAQELQHRVAFDKRIEIDDGAGNTRGEFQEQFTVWAALRPKGGSEAVIAARREGRNVYGVYVRSSEMTRTVTSDWRFRLLRPYGETAFAIDVVDAVTDRKWVYLEVTSGEAA